MPRYRVSFFVQHTEAEPNTGCHITVKVDARSADTAIVTGMADAVKICTGYHPELNGQPWRPMLKGSPVVMKALKGAQS